MLITILNIYIDIIIILLIKSLLKIYQLFIYIDDFFFFSFNIPDGNMRSYVSILERIVNQINPSFILCVVISNRADIYTSIKRKLCIDRAGNKFNGITLFLLVIFIDFVIYCN